MIWFAKAQLEKINERGKNTLSSLMGIEVTEMGDDFGVIFWDITFPPSGKGGGW